ncbi:MAG: CPBP family intramembrane metalloprotease [Bacilli bacterium]|nr:CPBP family intramembrane metalloprotease [Bacilli bacterium]
MYCRYCGKQIPDDAIFCSYCGKELAYNPGNKDSVAEVKNDKKNDPKYKKMKSDYSKGALACLIWFGALNVIGTLFLSIGMAIVLMIYLKNGGNFIIEEISDAFNIMFTLTHEDYYVVVPIMYTVGYIASSVAAILIGRKIVYGKNNENKVEKNIKKLSVKELLLVAIVAFGLWGIGVLIGNIPEFFSQSEGINQLELIFGNYTIIYLAQAMIGAPIIEEFIFRKLLIDKISTHGEGIAIITSAMLFGLMHGNFGQFFLAFFLGLLFAIIYTKTRNIKYTMGLHFMINTVASLPEIFMLFNINIETGWLIGIGVLALVGIILAIIFRKSELFKVNKECEFDGYLIHRSVVFEIFFIVLLVTLASTVISLNTTFVLDAISGHIDWLYLALMQIPIGAFIAVMLLYNHQMHDIFKAKVEEPLLEENTSEETEAEGTLEELADTEENE